jgi:hypothetical protein
MGRLFPCTPRRLLGKWKKSPLPLNFSTNWSWVVSSTPWLLYPSVKTMDIPKREAGWVPYSVWMFWRRGIFLSHTGIRTIVPQNPTCSPLQLLFEIFHTNLKNIRRIFPSVDYLGNRISYWEMDMHYACHSTLEYVIRGKFQTCKYAQAKIL